jgi:hypothetical protein
VSASVQYHVVIAKKEEIVVGDDRADIVITIPKADCGLDPTVAFMQGRLKATGNTGELFTLLRSGAVASALKPYAP